MADRLSQVLEPLGKVEVIVDRSLGSVKSARVKPSIHELGRDHPAIGGCIEFAIPATNAADGVSVPHYIWIPDKETSGYGKLMGSSGPFPLISAWSRAFVHLERTLGDDEAVWFVEDDVAGDAISFAGLVAKTVGLGADLSAFDLRTRWEDEGWPWWNAGAIYFSEPCAGFHPLCRLSGRLVRAVLDFRRRHGTFVFHEILFPSLARDCGMSWLDWRGNGFEDYIGDFHYRPELEVAVHGISHPVKREKLHEVICRLPSL